MVCMVRLADSGKMVPSCATVAEEGMTVHSQCDEVIAARTTALELLLSDHAGDCMGPCQVGCPASMDIPVMIRQIAAGDLASAVRTVKNDIALPAVLGRICPAPCEKVCRRNQLDDAVSICLLKRFVADTDLASPAPYVPACPPSTGKEVAVAGAGPAGLAAAYYLAQKGHKCTVFDDHDKPGGALRYGVSRDILAEDVLDREIELLMKVGIDFKGGTRIGGDIPFEKLCSKFDAVFVATGNAASQEVLSFGLKAGPKGIAVDGSTYQTSAPGVFAGGDAVRNRRLAVRSVADGKEAAFAIDRFLSGKPVEGAPRPFNTRIGKLDEKEIQTCRSFAAGPPRQTPAEPKDGLSNEQAVGESLRCLHCDCRKPDACRLRKYSQQYNARAGRYKGPRRLFLQESNHPDVIYESGKCIDCGLCVQITAAEGEKLGLAFVGRGFRTTVAPPFDKDMAQALSKTARKCAQACPTGALSLR
jgi:ferredoxin